MSRDQTTTAALQPSPAKEKLVGVAGASWGASSVQLALPGIVPAGTSSERNSLINKLARSIVAEAYAQFRDDPQLLEVWLEAAIEAASARL